MTRPRPQLAALLAVALLAGCVGTSADRLAAAERTYQAAADSTRIVVASRALDNKPTVLRAIRIANDEAHSALVKARTYTAADKPIDADFWIDRALAAAAQVAVALEQAKEQP